jgi:two-component sensor histidine kinase
MTLIEGISEELDGDLEIDSSRGFVIEITFPYAEKEIPAVLV